MQVAPLSCKLPAPSQASTSVLQAARPIATCYLCPARCLTRCKLLNLPCKLPFSATQPRAAACPCAAPCAVLQAACCCVLTQQQAFLIAAAAKLRQRRCEGLLRLSHGCQRVPVLLGARQQPCTAGAAGRAIQQAGPISRPLISHVGRAVCAPGTSCCTVVILQLLSALIAPCCFCCPFRRSFLECTLTDCQQCACPRLA